MPLTMVQTSLIIAAVALGAQITRWLPFIVFPEKAKLPSVVSYLGKVLPPAIMGFLVVYCLKNMNFVSVINWAPQIIAITFIVILHLWKHNVLLSICGGTVLYMILVQTVFKI